MKKIHGTVLAARRLAAKLKANEAIPSAGRITRQRRRAEREPDKSREQLKAQGHTGPIYAIGEPVPASTRGGIRTKGLPFSRGKLLGMKPSKNPGVRGTIIVRRANGHIRNLKATPELLRAFMPAAPDAFYAMMLGAA